MERCPMCLERRHLDCQGLTSTAWCECPCHTGEVSDPIGRFMADLGVLQDGAVVPLTDHLRGATD